MRRHYVYYRVDGRTLALAVSAAIAFQATMRARHPGLRAELLQRPGADAEGRVTLMEVYEPAVPTLAAPIEAAARAALARWVIGERHVEDFDAIG